MHLQLKYCNLEGRFFRLQAFQSSLQRKTWRTLLPRGVAEVVFFLFFLARDKNVLAKCILQGLPHCPISLIVLGCVRGSDNEKSSVAAKSILVDSSSSLHSS